MKSSYCFSKDLRLLTASDYQYVFNQASRSSDKFFTIIARENGLEKSRLGLAISKKAIKLAVQRNRIKRLVREYFRLNHNTPLPIDYVVMAKKGIDRKTNDTIKKSLHLNFSRLIKKF